MDWQTHFLRQADYHLWANQVLFDALTRLEPETLHQPQGLHFQSIAHSTGHLLMMLRLWAGRLRGETQEADPKTFRCDDWAELKHTLQQELRALRHLLEASPSDFFDQSLAYPRAGGEICHATVADVLTHLMNFFTHHRGQISAMAVRLGAPTPEMDYLYFTRDMARVEREAQALKTAQPSGHSQPGL